MQSAYIRSGRRVDSMKYVKMVLAGFLLIILIYIVQILVTIPFGLNTDPTEAEMQNLLFREFLFASVPAFFISFFSARILKISSFPEQVLHSAVWTGMYVILVFLLSWLPAIGNNNTSVIFGTPTIYILFALYFLGPLVSGVVKKSAKKPAV